MQTSAFSFYPSDKPSTAASISTAAPDPSSPPSTFDPQSLLSDISQSLALLSS